jgi:hypothetical protein
VVVSTSRPAIPAPPSSGGSAYRMLTGPAAD